MLYATVLDIVYNAENCLGIMLTLCCKLSEWGSPKMLRHRRNLLPQIQLVFHCMVVG